MRMGSTGTREGMSDRQKETLLKVLAEYKPAEFHHGDCVGRGRRRPCYSPDTLRDGQSRDTSANQHSAAGFLSG
jgi:hypothetical protein